VETTTTTRGATTKITSSKDKETTTISSSHATIHRMVALSSPVTTQTEATGEATGRTTTITMGATRTMEDSTVGAAHWDVALPQA
jgi:hypothetical protein